MVKSKTLCGLAVLSMGLACFGIDQWMNIDVIKQSEASWFSPMLWALPVSGIVSAGAIAIASDQFRSRQILIGLGVVLVFMVFTTFSLFTSLERVALSLNQKTTGIQSENLVIQRAETAYRDALAYRDKVRKDKLNECASGLGSKCLAQGALLTEAEQKLLVATKNRPDKVVQDDDVGTTNLAKMLPFIDKWYIKTYRPALLPIGLLLGGIFVTAAGMNILARGSRSAQEEDQKAEAELPLEYKIKLYFDNNPEASQAQAAEHFRVSKSTVSRKLKLVKS